MPVSDQTTTATTKEFQNTVYIECAVTPQSIDFLSRDACTVYDEYPI